MKSRLVLFDVDGTLVDTAGAGRNALLRAFSTTFDTDGLAERIAGLRFAGMTDPVLIENIAAAGGIDPSRLGPARTELERRYIAELADEMGRPDPRRRALPGVRPLLEALARRPDTRLGLITGNLEAGARIKLGPFGLNPFFAGGGFGSDHRDRREIARIAVARCSDGEATAFPAHRVTVVGDTEHDVDCARANGYRAVAVSTGWIPREQLARARPDVLLDALDDRAEVLAAL